MGNRKWGFHSGTLSCQDAKIKGDCYVQDDIVFSDVSAGTLGVTGGIDMQSTTSAIGIDMGGTFSTSAINIDGTCSHRALMIGTKDTGLTISTTGHTLDEEPANNYLFGLFSKVATTEATSADELRSAWIRTRVNVNCDIGSSAGWGYGICGAEVQLKFYGGTTKVYAWQNSALWAQLESQAATTTFKSGSYSQCVLANVGLTSATVDSGAVVAGVTINANTSTLTNNGGYYGLFITDKTGTNTDFQEGIHINNDVCSNGINVGTTTTGISIGNATTAINISGTGTGASARAISAYYSVANANYGDAYGLVEVDLTLTGTVAGMVGGLCSWINMASVTTGANMICAQQNGLWSNSGGVLTNGVFIFGMRAQCLLQTNGGVSGAKFYPFCVVNNTNVTTAIFKCNAGSSDLGTTAVSKTTEGKYVPLYTDDAGTHYVLIYN